MENQIPLIEFQARVRGCLAALELPLSFVAKRDITRRLNQLLNNYKVDDRGAQLKARALLYGNLRKV